MIERNKRAVHYGYGRMWTEQKAQGFDRFLQLLREPATGTSAPLMFAAMVAFYVLTMGAVYAVVHVDRWSTIETTDTQDTKSAPVS